MIDNGTHSVDIAKFVKNPYIRARPHFLNIVVA